MEEKIKYRIGFLVLCLALLFFIALQYLDVLSGAMVSKDSWLKKNYLFLAVGVMVVFGGFGAWLLREGEKKLLGNLCTTCVDFGDLLSFLSCHHFLHLMKLVTILVLISCPIA